MSDININICCKPSLSETIASYKLIFNLISDSNSNSCALCISFANKVYIVHAKKRLTWFDAKQYCFQHNQSIAVFARDDMSTIIDLLTPAFEGWTNKNAWIGLRLTEYYIQSNKGLFFLHKSRIHT